MIWLFFWEYRGLFWVFFYCIFRLIIGCWFSLWGRWFRLLFLLCVLWCFYVLWFISKNSYMNFWNKVFYISLCIDFCLNIRLWKYEDRIFNRFYMNLLKIWEIKIIIIIVLVKEMYNLIFFGEFSNIWYNSLKIYL